MTGDVPPVPAFSQDQILYLAPLLISAFSQATAEEQVTFLLTTTQQIKGPAPRGTFYSLKIPYFTWQSLNIGTPIHPNGLTI